MTTTQSISLRQLRLAADAIFDSLAEQGVDLVEVDIDYFWSIAPEQQFTMDAEPTEFTVGQVSESNQRMSNIVAKRDDPVTYSLVWLADTLRAVGLVLSGPAQ